MSAGTPSKFSRAVTRNCRDCCRCGIAPVAVVPWENPPQLPWHSARILDDGEDFAGARVRVSHQIAPIRGACVAGAAEVPAIGLRLAFGITAELGHGS